MKRQIQIAILASGIWLASCSDIKTDKKEQDQIRESTPLVAQKKATGTEVNHATLVFVYPDSAYRQQYISKYGQESWFRFSDSLGAAFFQKKAWCAEQQIPVLSSDTRYIRFKLGGEEITFDQRLLKNSSGSILFDGFHPPQILSQNTFEENSMALSPVRQEPEQKPVQKSDGFREKIIEEEIVAIEEKKIQRQKDSLFYLNLLPQISGIPDPVSLKRALRERTLPEIPLYDISRLNPSVVLKLVFENDIFSNTDRYFTNGSQIRLYNPAFANWLGAGLFIPYGRYATHTYGLGIVQNIYTPSTTKTGGILYGDRPYSGVLYLSWSRSSYDIKRRQYLDTEINAGVIGPASEAEFVQSLVHNVVPTNDEPLGWEYQIQNDVVLNYDLWFEKQWFQKGKFSANTALGAQIGTLYDKARFGASLHFTPAGNKFQTVSARLLRAPDGQINWNLYADLQGSLNVYDATLQGGMFNKSSVYTLNPSQIEDINFKIQLGGTFYYKWLGFRAFQSILSPEITGGKYHFWGSFELLFFID